MSVYQSDLKKILKTLLLKYETNITSNNINKKIDRFSIIDIRILEYLLENESISFNNLLQVIDIKRGKLIGIINRLISASYIMKTRSDVDKRSSILSLSSSGKKLLELYYKEEEEFLDFVLNDMTINEEKTIIKFLSKINQTKHMK